jgi:hypothetical protein
VRSAVGRGEAVLAGGIEMRFRIAAAALTVWAVLLPSGAADKSVRAEGGEKELPAVPDDRFLTPVREFPNPDAAKAREKFLLVHKIMESIYNGDGSWGKGYSDWVTPGYEKLQQSRKEFTHPLVRFTGNAVRAYLIADTVEPNEVFRKRAKEGLEWLLKEQQPGGVYRWYGSKEGTVDASSLQDTGIAGCALIAGYEAFKDDRYLKASEKAADWAAAQPLSENANSNLFAAAHLVAHYRVTKERKYLDAAVEKALGTLASQTGSGVWPDFHNQQIGYHSIITAALIDLLSVLPDEHPKKTAVRKGAIRAVNHIIREQQKDGSLRAHPFGGKWDGHGAGALFALPALIAGERQLDWKLGPVIAGLIQSPIGPEPEKKPIDPEKKETWSTLIDSATLFYAVSWQWAKAHGSR